MERNQTRVNPDEAVASGSDIQGGILSGEGGEKPKENMKAVSFPELPKLRQLILKVGAWEDDSLLEFTNLAKACPKLQRFVIQRLLKNQGMGFLRGRSKYCTSFEAIFETIWNVVINQNPTTTLLPTETTASSNTLPLD